MKLLSTTDMALELGLSIFTVQKYVQGGKIPGRYIGRTWVTTDREFRDYRQGKPVDKISTVELFSVLTAADYLDLEVRAVRKMIRDGKLKGARLDKRGRFGGTRVFTKRQVNTAKKFREAYAQKRGRGRPLKGDVEQYIEPGQDAAGLVHYHVLGTRNTSGQPFSYVYLHIARARAREAHNNPPVYKKGEQVEIYLPKYEEGDRCHRAFILDNVTPICHAALVQVQHPGHMLDGQELLVKVRNIIGKIE